MVSPRMAVIVPLYACIEVFVRLIDDPTASTWSSDFALLELGVAHFARIELYSDGKCSIPFARELAQLANDLHNNPLTSRDVQDPDLDASGAGGLLTPATRGAGTNDTAGSDGLNVSSSESCNEVLVTDAVQWPEGVPDILDLEWWSDDFDSWNLDGWI
jgi:hypothetical protein